MNGKLIIYILKAKVGQIAIKMHKFYQEKRIDQNGIGRGGVIMYDNIQKISWRKNQLWEGCMLATIAHAIMVAHYPEISNEHSWDGINYSVQDNEGSRGTITFHPEFCVGAFRNDFSERLNSINNFKEVKRYFNGAPKAIITLSEEEALQYLLEDIDGDVLPLITTAFWGIGNEFYTIDSFEDMYQNGVFLLERQLMDMDNAIESWAEYYDMDINQCNLLKKIFKRKLEQKNDKIILSKDEIQQIGSSDKEGLYESKTSFEEINIIWE